MAADVRSIAELRDWHAALGVYRAGLLEAMSGVEMEIRRAYDWLADTGRQWQVRVRDCEEEVVHAKADLAQRKFPMWDGRIPDCTFQEEALRRAKAKLEYCRDQVDLCRSWFNRLPKQIEDAYSGPSRRLVNLLEADLPSGLALLARRTVALEEYASLRADYAPSPSGATLPGAAVPATPAKASDSPPAGDPPVTQE